MKRPTATAKLALNGETIRVLSGLRLARARGGYPNTQAIICDTEDCEHGSDFDQGCPPTWADTCPTVAAFCGSSD